MWRRMVRNLEELFVAAYISATCSHYLWQCLDSSFVSEQWLSCSALMLSVIWRNVSKETLL